MKFSELLTVMYECSEMVIRRPIGKCRDDPRDGTYLCPNDLILVTGNGGVLNYHATLLLSPEAA